MPMKAQGHGSQGHPASFVRRQGSLASFVRRQGSLAPSVAVLTVRIMYSEAHGS